MRKKKRKKHTKIITKIVLFSGILIGGGIHGRHARQGEEGDYYRPG